MHNSPILPAANSPPSESLVASVSSEAPALPFAEVFEAIEDVLEDLLPDQLMALMPFVESILPQQPVEVSIDPETGKAIPVDPATPWLFEFQPQLPQIAVQSPQTPEMVPDLQPVDQMTQGTVELLAGDQPSAEEPKVNLEGLKPAAPKPLIETATHFPVELDPVQPVETEAANETSSAKEAPVTKLESQPHVQNVERKAVQSEIEIVTKEVSETPKFQIEKPVEPDAEIKLTSNMAETQMQVSKTFQANELARTAEARPAQIIEQISSTLETLLDSGKTSLRLQLHPEHLGRINLELSSGSDGLKVWITPDISSTSQLLQAEVQQLKQSMQEAGVTLTDVYIGPGSQEREAPKPFDMHGQDELRQDEDTLPELEQNNSLRAWRDSASTHEYLI